MFKHRRYRNPDNKLRQFYIHKIKPGILSLKHFFKSSLVFFKNHPRLRNVSIVVGIVFIVTVVSAIMNTYSRYFVSTNMNNEKYNEHTNEFWHNLSKSGFYSRPSLTISYTKSGEACADDGKCGMAGTGDHDTPYEISNVNQFMFVRSSNYADTAGKYYIVVKDLDFTDVTLDPLNTSNTDGFFGGFIDGNFKQIKGINIRLSGDDYLNTNGLIRAVKGTNHFAAGVKNFIINRENVVISEDHRHGLNAVGGLVGYLGEYAYVINSGVLSGNVTINDTNAAGINDELAARGLYVGSIVGFMDDQTNITADLNSASAIRNGIVNTYSYAAFSFGTSLGGTVRAGGILGYRANGYVWSNATSSLVVLSNYYGPELSNAPSADVFQYVYNGASTVESSRSPSFNYYWFKGDSRDITIDAHSKAIAKDSDYLESEGFVANLNSYGELLKFYWTQAFNEDATIANYLIEDTVGVYEENSSGEVVTDIPGVEWYISRKNYGNLRPYFPILRKKIKTQEQSTNNDGTLSVELDGKAKGTRTETITITNESEAIDDFVYHKIKLPYAVDLYGTNYLDSNKEYIFNGWKLTYVEQSGTECSRGCDTNAPISGNSYNYIERSGTYGVNKNIGEVYAEGGYYLVPDGVTKVKFEAIWARAIYLSDNFRQAVFNVKSYSYNYTQSEGYGNRFPGTPNGSYDHPYISLSAAYTAAAGVTHSDMYDVAIVLRGNYHESFGGSGNNDNLSSNWYNNTSVTIRSVDDNEDKKPDYSMFIRNYAYLNIGNVRFDFINLLDMPQVAGYNGGLNSFFIREGQSFETTETVVTDLIKLFTVRCNHVKLLGGYFDIYSNYNASINDIKNYLIFGGKARANVISGGYLSSNGEISGKAYPPAINIVGGRIGLLTANYSSGSATYFASYIYVDGGYVDEFYSVYKGNATERIYSYLNNAYFNHVYGGGYADTAYIKQGIKLQVDNCRIGDFFGGPRFGVVDGNLEIDIDDSELDYVYGGGYGGNQIFTTEDLSRSSVAPDRDNRWSNSFSYNPGTDHFQWIKDGYNIYRTDTNYISRIYSVGNRAYNQIDVISTYLSVAKTQTIRMNINNSRVNNDVYGGGNRGKVEGDIYLNLYNTYVGGDVYGASLTGDVEPVKVNDSAGVGAPPFYNYAIDSEVTGTADNTYNWYYYAYNYGILDTTNKRIGSVNYGHLGETTAGNIFINMSGENQKMYVKGSVYGGSYKAPVEMNNTGTIHINIGDGVYIKESVYGGSRAASVNGNTVVIVDNPDINNRTEIGGGVYGSGQGGAGSEANVHDAVVIISGNPIVNKVYGGGEYSSANETNVYIQGGDITEIYGGSSLGGIVQDTRVYIGKDSGIEKNKGEIVEVNLCSLGGLTYEKYQNGDGRMIKIRNRLQGIAFKEWTFKLKLTAASARNIRRIDHWGDYNVHDEYSDGVITFKSYNGNDQLKKLCLANRGNNNNQLCGRGDDQGSTYTVANEFETRLIPYNNSNQISDFDIESVEFIGYDLNGNRYSYTDCAYNTSTVQYYWYSWWNNNNGDISAQAASPTIITEPLSMSDAKVGTIFGGNDRGGRAISTNVLTMPSVTTGSNRYSVEVGSIYGGGNEAQTGPDIEGRDGDPVTIETYNNNNHGWTGFDHDGWKFVPTYKSRILIYGTHVTGDIYGGGKGNDEKTSKPWLSTMYSTPMILVTNNAQIDGNVYGAGEANNANIGNDVDNTPDDDVDNRVFIKPMVFIDWGTVNKNVYGGGYGDIVYGGTMTYVNLFNPYNIYNYVRQWFFQMQNDSMSGDHNGVSLTDEHSPFRGLTTIQNNPNRGSTIGHVNIKGSVYGGGERGEKDGGFDYLFESVIDGTSVYVQEDRSICLTDIEGDIFGSGNFSSSAGYSDVLILNVGSLQEPKKMKSIQRAEHVYINGSYIELEGGTDVTNKFNKTKYAFSRVDHLHLGDNTELYLRAQANLLQNVYFYEWWTDMLDHGWTYKRGSSLEEHLLWVNLTNDYVNDDGEQKRVISGYRGNYMSRLYLLNDKGLNILTQEEVAQGFGHVHGMGFFGLFTDGANGKPNTSYFSRSNDLRHNDRNVTGFTKTTMNAYILGSNDDGNMDYTKNGFITNTYIGRPGSGRLYTTVVNPTPRNQLYYYWTIGNPVIATEINLSASKYIRSGMKSLTLYNFDPQTYNRVIFDIAEIDVSGLTTEANYIDPSAVPTLAETDEDAVKTFGLSIETSDAGWLNEGLTYFESDYNGGDRTGIIRGTTKYETAGSANIPQLVFNLENSRNIKSDVDLGYMMITINAHAYSISDPLNAVNSTFKVRVNMDTFYYEDNEYESSMAPGKHYKSFLSAPTNITSNSEFSTYYNMYAYGINMYDYIKEKQYKDDEVVTFDHALYSTYVLPAGTRITMLDISTNEPKYYYYDVTGSEVLDTEDHKKVNGEHTDTYVYPLSWFKAMDVTSDGDKYDEAINQARYVFEEGDTISTIEQFIFMVDFKNVTQHTKPINQITFEEFFLGLRATVDGTSKRIAYPMYETMKDMHFNIFDEADVGFDMELYNTPDEDDTIYVDDEFEFGVNVGVSDPVQSRDGESYLVRNTNYYQDRLGLRVGLYHITVDDQGNERATLVSGDELAGAVFYIDGLGYAPSANGFVRLKMADFVVDVNKTVKVDLTNAEHLTSGLYEFRVTAFASGDGMYAKQGDTVTNSIDSFRVNLVNEHYGLLATIDDDKDVIVYSDGKTSGGTDTIETTVNYFGSYQNPNIKISLKRRDYTTVKSYTYNDVNFADYFDVSLTSFSDTSQLDRTDLFNSSTMTIKKEALVSHVSSADMGIYKLTFKLKQGVDLPTGTYRIMYNLYNGDKVVGDVYTYIIIKD